MGGLGAKKFETYTAVQIDHDSKFADGMGEKDVNGEKIRVKGSKGLETYDTLVQMQEDPKKTGNATTASRPTGPIRGEKQW